MNLPVKVFLDTNIFEQCRYTFKKGDLATLKKHIDDKNILLLLTDVVYGECKTHIERNVDVSIGKINNFLKTPVRKRDPEADHETCTWSPKAALEIISSTEKYKGGFEILYEILSKHNKKDLVNTALAEFEAFLEETNTQIISSNNVNPAEIIDDYFNLKPPFEKKITKKYEFPDAFTMKAIISYASENGKVFVVSDDKAFGSLEDSSGTVTVLDSLKELFENITDNGNEKEFEEQVMIFIREHEQEVIGEIENSAAFNDTSVIDYEGRICEESETLKISGIEIEDCYIEYKSKDSLQVALSCNLVITVSALWLDSDNSVWDPEFHVYYLRRYYRTEEIHRIEFTANTKLKYSDDHITEIVSVNVSEDNILLDESTLIEVVEENPEADYCAEAADTLEEYYRH